MSSSRISRIFALPFRHPRLLFTAVLFAVVLYAASSPARLYEIENPRWIITMGALLLIPPFFDGLFIHLVHGIKTGKPILLGEAVTRTLPCYARLVAVAILVNLGVLLGLFLFFLPGIYLALRWIFYRQGIVIDGARGTTCLRMSIERTRGWRAIVSLLGFLAAIYAPTFLIGYAVIVLPLGMVGEGLVIAVSTLTFAWVNTLLTELYITTGAAAKE